MNYHLHLAKNAYEGLCAAIKTHGAPRGPVFLGRCTFETITSFGYVPDEKYLGVIQAQLMDPAKLAQPCQVDGTIVSLVLPPGRQGQGLGEVFERIRPRLKTAEPTWLILEYAMIEGDLPPLRGEDRVTCWWHARETLTPTSWTALQHVQLSAQAGSTPCECPRLFTRGEQMTELVQARMQQISTHFTEAISDCVILR